MSEWIHRAVLPLMLTFQKKKYGEKGSIAHAMILYIQVVFEAVGRILSHLDVKVNMKPKHPLRSILSRPKDQIPDADKSNGI